MIKNNELTVIMLKNNGRSFSQRRKLKEKLDHERIRRISCEAF